MMRRRALYGGMIVIECVLWGLGNPLIKIAGQALTPFAAIFFRFFLALLLFLLGFGRRFFAGLRRARLLPVLLVSTCTAVAFSLGSLALMFTDAVIAGFLMGIAVLFTPFLEPILLGTRFRFRVLPLVAFVCAGMYLLCAAGGAFVFGVGELLAVLCSLFFALMLTLSQKYIAALDSIVLSTMQCVVGAVLGFFCMLLFEGMYDLRQLSWQGVGAVGYIALGSTFLAYLLQNRAMRHIPATFASVVFCTEPVFTVIFSYLLLGERLHGLGYIGAGVILAGVIAASLMKE